MKLLPLIIICYFMMLVCCTSKPADNTSIASQTVAADTTEAASTDTTSIVRSLDEDFIAFIKRFHTDTVFQQQRVCDSVYGYFVEEDLFPDDDCDMDTVSIPSVVWNNDSLKAELRYYDSIITNPRFSRTISLISDTVIAEKIFIEGSGALYFLEFTNKGHQWFLTYLDATNILGNVRTVFDQFNYNFVQKTDYYPYGLPKATSTNPSANRFKYGGKELETDLHLTHYDFEARMQLPTLGLFQRPDPKAGDYLYIHL